MNELKQSVAPTARMQKLEMGAGRRADEETEIDLLELFQAMLHKLWLIILLLVLGAGVAFGATKLLITPMYTASSEIYILTKTTSVTSLADIQMGAQITSDFAVLAKSRPVVESVIKDFSFIFSISNGLYKKYDGLFSILNSFRIRLHEFNMLLFIEINLSYLPRMKE